MWWIDQSPYPGPYERKGEVFEIEGMVQPPEIKGDKSQFALYTLAGQMIYGIGALVGNLEDEPVGIVVECRYLASMNVTKLLVRMEM